jgi:hypothetical protein
MYLRPQSSRLLSFHLAELFRQSPCPFDNGRVAAVLGVVSFDAVGYPLVCPLRDNDVGQSGRFDVLFRGRIHHQTIGDEARVDFALTEIARFPRLILRVCPRQTASNAPRKNTGVRNTLHQDDGTASQGTDFSGDMNNPHGQPKPLNLCLNRTQLHSTGRPRQRGGTTNRLACASGPSGRWLITGIPIRQLSHRWEMGKAVWPAVGTLRRSLP